MRPHASFLISRRMVLLNNLCACSCLHSNTEYESQGAGDEYLRKAKLNTEYASFLTELQQMPAAAPIQQKERNGIKLVADCIKEGMWLESHYLASLLPLKSVTNLDYRIQLRSQWILTPLESGGA
jgi:hypothetical protein